MNFLAEFDQIAIESSTLGEEAFHRMISIERRRTKRSSKSFMLMLLDIGEHASSRNNQLSLRKIMSTLSLMLRETDVTGWYKEDSVVGVMFTEITLDDQGSIPATMMARVTDTLRDHLTPQQFRQISISFHLQAEAHAHGISGSMHPAVYPAISLADSESSL